MKSLTTHSQTGGNGIPFRLVALGLAFLVLAVAGIIIHNLVQTNRQVQQMYAESIRGIKVSGEVMDRVQEARLHSLYTLASTDPNVQLESADASRARDPKVSSLLQELRALFEKTDAPATGSDLAEHWAAYRKIRDEVLANVLEGSREEGLQLDRRAGLAAFNRLHAAAERSEEASTRQAATRLEQIQALSRRNIFTVTLMLSLMLLGAGLALRTLSRSARLLHRSRERFEIAVTGSSDGLWDWDLVTNTVYFSPRWKSMLGYGDAELTNCFETFRGLIHPDDVPPVLGKVETYLAGTTAAYEMEFRVRHKGGEYRWILSRGAALRDAQGKAVRFAGSHSDITARKQIDDSLRQTLTMQRAIFDAASHAIVSSGVDGTVRSFNRAAEQMLGYEAGEVVGLATPALWHDGAEVAIRAAQLSRELEVSVAPGFECFIAKARLQIPDENEWTVIRKDGSRLPVLLSVTAMSESSGEICGYLGILRDISARKAASAEMARLNRELVAASRTAGMAEVATGVLHNVGNVLNSVNVSMGVIHEKLDASRVGRLGQACDLMAENRERLGDYLTRDPKGSKLPEYLRTLATGLQKERDDLKAEATAVLTRVEHIKQIVASQQSFARQGGALENLSPVGLFDEALQIQEGAFHRHHVQVVREDLTSRWVLADRHRTLQVLINLLGNAKAAMSNMPLEDRRLILRLEAGDQDRVCFSVIDSGCGISAENLAKIFRHGFTTKKEGHGFGLHSCANAAAEMKGSLRVHSDGPGKGSTFTLELPSAPSPRTAPVAQPESATESLSKLSLP